MNPHVCRLVLFLLLVPRITVVAHAADTSAPAPAPVPREVVLRDQFDSFPSGSFSKVLWARAEYHYLPESAPVGPWTLATYFLQVGSQRAWKVVEHDGKKVMLQTYTPRSDKHAHPMLIAGDPAWRDYRLAVRFAPLTRGPRAGMAFRYRNSRCHYFFGVEGNQALLNWVQHETAFRTPHEKILASKPFSYEPGDDLDAEVTVLGPKMQLRLNGELLFEVEDATFAEGKIGLTSDGPTRFGSVEVTMTAIEKEQVERRIREREAAETLLQDLNPRPQVWKRISLGDFGVGRNLRFGDLDHDGQIDVLVGQIEHHGPKDRFSELSCLTAVTLEGKVLWQVGEPDSWKDHLTNDVAFQIHDLDGDGKNEVIYCRHQELIVAEGATGKTKLKVPTPAIIPDPKNPSPFPRILGDSMFFGDLRGSGRADHLILKDRYTHFWVMNPKLETMWFGSCQTGHYPYSKDLDGDGRDELLMGYSVYSGDGTKVWSLDAKIQDHADAVAAVNLHPDKPEAPKILCAASDEGFYIADAKGNILKRHRIGHAQNLTVANFRSDLPGLEMLIMNYWGNQGIAHFLDAEGEITHDFEPCNHGSMNLPINWTGAEEEFFVLSPNVERGGLFDGHGRRAVKFPADGHPDMCYMVLDLTGDCRDEIVVWDPFELWVYTQSDSPKPGRLYRPTRNPLHNLSNYGATVSLPGWSEPAAK